MWSTHADSSGEYAMDNVNEQPSAEHFHSGEENSEEAKGSELVVMCCSLGTGQCKHGDDIVQGWVVIVVLQRSTRLLMLMQKGLILPEFVTWPTK